MTTGILKESGSEKRVSMLPGEAAVLKKMGVQVIVENNAGLSAFSSDKDYSGAGILPLPRKELFSKAELLLFLKVILNYAGRVRFFAQSSIRLRTAHGSR
jgi:NAD(P) transhydrogenase subunit alpha